MGVDGQLKVSEEVLAGESCGRPLRADARRNRELLITAARIAFNRDGAATSMDAVAKEAGVGVGTIYRHFPKRIDLVQAVYRNDVDELVTAAERAVTELEPWAAIASWLEAFVRYAEGKRTLLTELREAFAKNPELQLESRQRIEYASGLVLARAQAFGVVRDDIDGADLMQLVGPMCTSTTLAPGQSDRLLSMILDGLRPRLDPPARA